MCGLPSMRTTFLHFLYPQVVPIYDRMVLRAVGFSEDEAKEAICDIGVLRRYLLHAWRLSDRYQGSFPNDAKETPVRLIDMALWVKREL